MGALSAKVGSAAEKAGAGTGSSAGAVTSEEVVSASIGGTTAEGITAGAPAKAEMPLNGETGGPGGAAATWLLICAFNCARSWGSIRIAAKDSDAVVGLALNAGTG